MLRMLPANPRKKTVIDAAVERGWRHEKIHGKDVLRSISSDMFVVLQDIGEDCFYSHSVASSYARSLGLAIDSEKAKSITWSPSEGEKT